MKLSRAVMSGLGYIFMDSQTYCEQRGGKVMRKKMKKILTGIMLMSILLGTGAVVSAYDGPKIKFRLAHTTEKKSCFFMNNQFRDTIYI